MNSEEFAAAADKLLGSHWGYDAVVIHGEKPYTGVLLTWEAFSKLERSNVCLRQRHLERGEPMPE